MQPAATAGGDLANWARAVGTFPEWIRQSKDTRVRRIAPEIVNLLVNPLVPK
jgi:hypothetical protein